MRGTKILSVMLSAALLASGANLKAFAEETNQQIPYSTYNYVALGDSIAAGFGLAGGDLAKDPALVITDELLADPVQGAYPAIFTQYISELGEKYGVEVKGTNLASTAYRAEDIEKTLRNQGYKGEFAASILDTYVGNGASDVLSPYHDIYNKYLTEADLVSIQLGGNDIVMSIIPEMTESENPVLRATGISLMLTLFGTDQKTALGGGLQIIQQNKDSITSETFIEAAAYMQNIGARAEELVNESANHVKGVVDAVQEINDDADIALVGMYNPYRTAEASEETAADISDILGKLYSQAADTAAETEDELTSDGEQTKDYIEKISDKVENIEDMNTVVQKYDAAPEAEKLMDTVKGYEDINEVKALAEIMKHSGGSPAQQELMQQMKKYNNIEELQKAIDIVKENDDVSELKDLAGVMEKYRTAEGNATAQAIAKKIAGPMMMQMAGRNVDPQMKLLNTKLKAIAEETGATYVDVYGISPETDSDPHPNANGHKEIAGILFDTMSGKVSERMEAMEEVTSDGEDVTSDIEVTSDEEKNEPQPVEDEPKAEPQPTVQEPKDEPKSAQEEPKNDPVPVQDEPKNDPKPVQDEPKNEPKDEPADKNEAYKGGDINGDGQVDVSDIAAAAAHIKGVSPLDEEAAKRADVNGDGKLNVTDIALIAAHIKGIKAIV